MRMLECNIKINDKNCWFNKSAIAVTEVIRFVNIIDILCWIVKVLFYLSEKL